MCTVNISHIKANIEIQKPNTKAYNIYLNIILILIMLSILQILSAFLSTIADVFISHSKHLKSLAKLKPANVWL